MNDTERKLAKRVIARSRRVLEKRRQLDLAERDLKKAVAELEALAQSPTQPSAGA